MAKKVKKKKLRFVTTTADSTHKKCILKDTSTHKANGRLIVENMVLFQMSVASPAMRHQCQEKQGLPITSICFKTTHAPPS